MLLWPPLSHVALHTFKPQLHIAQLMMSSLNRLIHGVLQTLFSAALELGLTRHLRVLSCGESLLMLFEAPSDACLAVLEELRWMEEQQQHLMPWF